MAEHQISVTLKPSQRELLASVAEDLEVAPATLAARLISEGLNQELEKLNRVNVYYKMKGKRKQEASQE